MKIPPISSLSYARESYHFHRYNTRNCMKKIEQMNQDDQRERFKEGCLYNSSFLRVITNSPPPFDLSDKTCLERIREFREQEYRFQIFHCRLATTDVPVFKGEPARGTVNRVCMNYRSRPDTEARKRSKESVSTFQFSRSREISDSIVHSTPPFSFRSIRATSFSSPGEGLKR